MSMIPPPSNKLDEWGTRMKIILESKTSINSETGCWEYLGAEDRGYGLVMVDYVKYRTHVLSAVLYLGYNPTTASYEGLHVLHNCDNRRCWNPAHLYIGTEAENARDRSEAGTTRNQNTDKTHCDRGHEFTPENTYEFISKRDGTLQRNCKQCKIEMQRERRKMLKFGKVA